MGAVEKRNMAVTILTVGVLCLGLILTFGVPSSSAGETGSLPRVFRSVPAGSETSDATRGGCWRGKGLGTCSRNCNDIVIIIIYLQVHFNCKTLLDLQVKLNALVDAEIKVVVNLLADLCLKLNLDISIVLNLIIHLPDKELGVEQEQQQEQQQEGKLLDVITFADIKAYVNLHVGCLKLCLVQLTVDIYTVVWVKDNVTYLKLVEVIKLKICPCVCA